MSQTAAPRTRTLPPLLAISPAAATRLASLMAGSEQGRRLRIGVANKGCSGMSYNMSWVDTAGPGDELVEGNGVGVLVERAATLFLIGTTMDWESGVLSSGFVFRNPNEKGRCGCGESFHV